MAAFPAIFNVQFFFHRKYVPLDSSIIIVKKTFCLPISAVTITSSDYKVLYNGIQHRYHDRNTDEEEVSCSSDVQLILTLLPVPLI